MSPSNSAMPADVVSVKNPFPSMTCKDTLIGRVDRVWSVEDVVISGLIGCGDGWVDRVL